MKSGEWLTDPAGCWVSGRRVRGGPASGRAGAAATGSTGAATGTGNRCPQRRNFTALKEGRTYFAPCPATHGPQPVVLDNCVLCLSACLQFVSLAM